MANNVKKIAKFTSIIKIKNNDTLAKVCALTQLLGARYWWYSRSSREEGTHPERFGVSLGTDLRQDPCARDYLRLVADWPTYYFLANDQPSRPCQRVNS